MTAPLSDAQLGELKLMYDEWSRLKQKGAYWSAIQVRDRLDDRFRDFLPALLSELETARGRIRELTNERDQNALIAAMASLLIGGSQRLEGKAAEFLVERANYRKRIAELEAALGARGKEDKG